ncbi:hypothetical protein IM816_06200 [Luteibacter flocculans]|uniref:DUF5666 domain-containing protein n=1 Tax=Luteibacter flocculans TaxID=2780091 RepID=A0ABY4T6Z2_9GAMM|nr:hypothetical protein [Luteibacter flocculans]URL59683.1 hypothetical protein IM816_06200 [Luteibacter flocculans]
MNSIAFVRATGVALILALVAGAAVARSDDPPPDTLCTVLGTAQRYVGTTVTVRGTASTEGKTTLLSDAQCKAAIGLTMDDASSRKRDIASFRRTVAGKGVRADATVFGRFKATGDAQTPYAIDVYSVRDVSERPAEGG